AGEVRLLGSRAGRFCRALFGCGFAFACGLTTVTSAAFAAVLVGARVPGPALTGAGLATRTALAAATVVLTRVVAAPVRTLTVTSVVTSVDTGTSGSVGGCATAVHPQAGAAVFALTQKPTVGNGQAT